MKKLFVKKLVVLLTVVFLIFTSSFFILQTQLAQSDVEKIAEKNVGNMISLIDNNSKSITSLTESLNETYLQKARALATMINDNPRLLNSKKSINKLVKMLGVEDISITDEKGILRWSNVPAYIGFDFSTSEQTKPFLPAINDKNFELVQEAQLNGALGILFQYIGVARIDKPGVVQVGVAPDRLEKALENNKIENVISSFVASDNHKLLAIRKDDKSIISYEDSSYIGKPVTELGLDETFLENNQYAKFQKIDEKNVMHTWKVMTIILLSVMLIKD